MTQNLVLIGTILITTLVVVLYLRRILPAAAQERTGAFGLSRRQLLLLSVLPFSLAAVQLIQVAIHQQIDLLVPALVTLVVTLFVWWAAWRTPPAQ